MKIKLQAQISNHEKKERVVSFRFSETEVRELQAHLPEYAPRGIRSDNQLARRIVLDFLRTELGRGNNRG
jgi:hypothetical protein